MYNFLVQYWPFISTGLVVLVTIIFALIRKRPITELIDSSGWHDLITFVTEAEELYGKGNGSKKLAYVVDKYFSSRKLKKDYLKTSLIEACVEEILDTPERKEKK